MRVCLALACLGSVAMASTAIAQPDRVATEIRLSDAWVEFSDPASTAAFYASLGRAAHKACDSGKGRNLKVMAEDRKCAAEALDRAVGEIGTPTLMALHLRQTGRPAPLTVLAAQ